MSQLPKLADLQASPEVAFKHDELNYLLSQPVPKAWVKKHPIIKVKNEQGQYVPLEYIPVDKQKFLLRKIFKRFKIEIIDKGVMFQSVFVHVRVHYVDPVSGDWDFHDGIGAVGVQTDAGESAANLGAIKADAVMKALPAAESYAVKNACDNFGILFGEGLNKNAAQFQPYTPPVQTEKTQPTQTETPSSTSTDFDNL